jgi:hypothetical protein
LKGGNEKVKAEGSTTMQGANEKAKSEATTATTTF